MLIGCLKPFDTMITGLVLLRIFYVLLIYVTADESDFRLTSTTKGRHGAQKTPSIGCCCTQISCIYKDTERIGPDMSCRDSCGVSVDHEYHKNSLQTSYICGEHLTIEWNCIPGSI